MRGTLCPLVRSQLACGARKQPLVVELWSGVWEAMSNMNHGMTFCPVLASILFMFAVANLAFPNTVRRLTRRSPLSVVKRCALLILPLLCFQLFWRPYNFFIYFLMNPLLSPDTLQMFMSTVCWLSAVLILTGSLYVTARPHRLYGKKQKVERHSRRRRNSGNRTGKKVLFTWLPTSPPAAVSQKDKSLKTEGRVTRSKSHSPRRNISFLNLDIDPTYRCTRSGHVFGKGKYDSSP